MSILVKTYSLPSQRTLEIAQGDLTQEKVDAIVNAANERLMHGGGIAAAISRAGGPRIDQESSEWIKKHGLVSHAEPAYTTGGELPARFVIHAVGPIWGCGDEDRKLVDAIQGSLRCAARLNFQTIAFPAISTGIFGFPKDRAARLFFQAIPDYFEKTPTASLQWVKVVLWDQASVDIFLAAADSAFQSQQSRNNKT